MHDLETEFEAERDHLMAVGYRMLGSRAEAEDAVQETWLRYAAALADPRDRAEIRELRGWLTTITARICLDVLRSARVRRETYPGQWLPEPVVSRLPDEPTGAAVAGPRTFDAEPGSVGDRASGYAPDPAERAAQTDEVGMALLVVLERLSPEQRVAFVLHDVFAVPFAEIAAVLSTSPAAARQLASRARRAVTEGQPRHTADRTEQRRLLAAFLAATESGDLDRLIAVLAPDVTFVGDGGDSFPSVRQPINGAVQVARFALGLFGRLALDLRTPRGRPVLVNGGIGLQSEGGYGSAQLRFVTWITADAGRITGIFNQLNPDKLTRVPTLTSYAHGWPPRL